MSETAQDQITTEEQAAPNLTLQDLILVAQVIQQTTSRGAFRAEEMETIGGLYNRVVKFLEASGAVTRAGDVTTSNTSEE
jgi:hypothetical protein